MSAAALKPRPPHPTDDPRVREALVEIAVRLSELTEPHLSTATPGMAPITCPHEGQTKEVPPSYDSGTGVVARAGQNATRGAGSVESARPHTVAGRES